MEDTHSAERAELTEDELRRIRDAAGRPLGAYEQAEIEFVIAERVRAAMAEALREAADDWPREVNAETYRRELAHPNLRDVPPVYTTADWLRERADRIGGQS